VKQGPGRRRRRAQAKDTIGTRAPATTGGRSRRKGIGGRPDPDRNTGERVTGIDPHSQLGSDPGLDQV